MCFFFLYCFLHFFIPPPYASLISPLFLFPQNFSQVSKTSSLNESHKSFASILTNSFTLSLNFPFFFHFHTYCCRFRFIFMRLNRFSFFISTATNLCCNSQGITLTFFFKNILLLFPPKQNQFQFHYHLNGESPSFSPSSQTTYSPHINTGWGRATCLFKFGALKQWLLRGW